MGIETEHNDYIRRTIILSEEGDTPFGSLIVQHGKIVASGYNTARRDRDVTAHAEMNVIREACRELGTTNLEDCVLYSSAEPCPMCMSAILWAGIPRLVFGARTEELREYVPVLQPSCREMAAASGRKIEIISGILEDLCLAPIRLMAMKNRK